MSFPWLTSSRLRPVRRLTSHECELLEYEGPLLLARREHRFLIGPWRPTGDVLVTRQLDRDGSGTVLMVCTPDQLRALGVDPDRSRQR